jgi:hypothetical protein
MKLTRNFSLAELIKSDTAIRKGIDNNPNADQIEKLNPRKQLLRAYREDGKTRYKPIIGNAVDLS